MFYANAEPALAKLSQGGAAVLTVDESAALEAVVIADGTRPSFLLNDGKPAPDDPFLGTWADLVAAHGSEMQKVARAVGRIQPGGGHASRFFGTGTLIDREHPRVLTNYHVIDDARRRGVAMTENGRTLTINGALEIDFMGESDSLTVNRFRLVEVALPEGAGRGHGTIDAAVARIEPIDDASVLPDPVPAFSSAASRRRRAQFARDHRLSRPPAGDDGDEWRGRLGIRRNDAVQEQVRPQADGAGSFHSGARLAW